jgi:hypothetical protein
MSENDFECLASTGRKIPAKGHVGADEHAIPTGHRQTHALVLGIAQTDGEATSFHFGCKIEHAEHFHPIRRYRIFVVDDSDVAKPERFDQCTDDLAPTDPLSVTLLPISSSASNKEQACAVSQR